MKTRIRFPDHILSMIPLLILTMWCTPGHTSGPGPDAGVTYQVSSTGATSGNIAQVVVTNTSDQPVDVTLGPGYIPSQNGFQGFILSIANQLTVPPNASVATSIFGYCSMMSQPTTPQQVDLPGVEEWTTREEALPYPAPGMDLTTVPGFARIRNWQEVDYRVTYTHTDIPFPYTIDFNTFTIQSTEILLSVVYALEEARDRLKNQGLLRSELITDKAVLDLMYVQYPTWIATATLGGHPLSEADIKQKLEQDFQLSTFTPVEDLSRSEQVVVRKEIDILFGQFVLVGTEAKVFGKYDPEADERRQYLAWALEQIDGIHPSDTAALALWEQTRDTIRYALARLSESQSETVRTALDEKLSAILLDASARLDTTHLAGWTGIEKLAWSDYFQILDPADQDTFLLRLRSSFNRLVSDHAQDLDERDSSFLTDWTALRALSISDLFDKYSSDETREEVNTILVKTFSRFLRSKVDEFDPADTAQITDWNRTRLLVISDWFDTYTDPETKAYVHRKMTENFSSYMRKRTEELDPDDPGFLPAWRKTLSLYYSDWFTEYTDTKTKTLVTQGLKDTLSRFMRNQSKGLDPEDPDFLPKWRDLINLYHSDWFSDWTDNETKTTVTRTLKEKFSDFVRNKTEELDPTDPDFLPKWRALKTLTDSDWFDDWTFEKVKKSVTEGMKDKFSAFVRHKTDTLDPDDPDFLEEWRKLKTLTQSDWFDDNTDQKTKTHVSRGLTESFSTFLKNRSSELDPSDPDFLPKWSALEKLLHSDWYETHTNSETKTQVTRTMSEKLTTFVKNRSEELDPKDPDFLEKWKKLETLIHSDWFSTYVSKSVREQVTQRLEETFKAWRKSRPASDAITPAGTVNMQQVHSGAFLEKSTFTIPPQGTGTGKVILWTGIGTVATGTAIILLTTDKGTEADPCDSDTEPPILSCSPTREVDCTQGTDPSVTGQPLATDNCPGLNLVYSDQSIGTGIISRVWTATDRAGNSSQCTETITLIDETPPTINCPGEIILDYPSDYDPALTGHATATDACDPNPSINWSDQVLSGNCPGNFQVERTWSATDMRGNTTSCLQTIRIRDIDAPAITCPADRSLDCTEPTDPSHTGTATATDTGDPLPEVTFTDDPTSNGVIRTWTATDHCGNTSQCTQTITLTDNAAPQISCPDDRQLEWPSSTDPSTTGTATATDNCDPQPSVNYSDMVTNGDCTYDRITTRTWTATDQSGNSSSCEQLIRVTDQQPPTLICPDDRTIDCAASTDPSSTGQATATDLADPDPGLTFIDEPFPGGINRTWQATDACGNSSSCTQVITQEDTQAPQISCPPDRQLEWPADPDPTLTGTATATDNCSPGINITHTDEIITGACPFDQTVQRTWSAQDDSQNSSECVQSIRIIDTTPPVIACPDDRDLPCGTSTDPAQTGEPIVNDLADPDPVITYEDRIRTGGLDRIWTVTDACGNTAQCTQRIGIMDEEAPIVTCPDDLTIDCVDEPTMSLTGSPVFSDNCDPDPTFSYSDEQTPGDCPQTYTLERTFTVTDNAGNQATCVQTIEISDDTGPQISCPGTVVRNCTDPTEPAQTGEPVVTDDCDPDVTWTWEDRAEAGSCPGNQTIIRTFAATDACGNHSECVQTIEITDDVPPSITCPPDITTDCAETDPALTGEATATDDCQLSVSDITYVDDQTALDQLQRTWVARDSCGNESTCIQLITLGDLEPPTITCPGDVQVTCGDPTSPAQTGEAESPETGVDISYRDSLVGNLLYRIWSAVDSCGNQADCTQEITIEEDTEAPVIDCPDDAFISCTDNPDISLTGEASASDDCDPEPVLIYTDELTPGDCPGSTILIRTWTATDAAGNSSDCEQRIYLDDTEAPRIDCPGTMVLSCDEPNDPSVTGIPVVTDNCDPDASYLFNGDQVVFQDCPNTYEIERSWLAVDGCGNTSECIQVIRIEDNQPPDLACPIDRTIQCDQDISPAFTGTAIVFGDNCDPNPSPPVFSDNIIPGGCPNSYIIERTWTSTDACGNQAICVQNIFVEDNMAPIPVFIPPNVNLFCEPPTFVEPEFVDNCDPTIDLTNEVLVDEVSPELTVFTVMWFATDDCGNVNSVITIYEVFCPIVPRSAPERPLTIYATQQNGPLPSRTRPEPVDPEMPEMEPEEVTHFGGPWAGLSWQVAGQAEMFGEFGYETGFLLTASYGTNQLKRSLFRFGGRQYVPLGKARCYLEAALLFTHTRVQYRPEGDMSIENGKYGELGTGLRLYLNRHMELDMRQSLICQPDLKAWQPSVRLNTIVRF